MSPYSKRIRFRPSRQIAKDGLSARLLKENARRLTSHPHIAEFGQIRTNIRYLTVTFKIFSTLSSL